MYGQADALDEAEQSRCGTRLRYQRADLLQVPYHSMWCIDCIPVDKRPLQFTLDPIESDSNKSWISSQTLGAAANHHKVYHRFERKSRSLVCAGSEVSWWALRGPLRYAIMSYTHTDIVDNWGSLSAFLTPDSSPSRVAKRSAVVYAEVEGVWWGTSSKLGMSPYLHHRTYLRPPRTLTAWEGPQLVYKSKGDRSSATGHPAWCVCCE